MLLSVRKLVQQIRVKKWQHKKAPGVVAYGASVTGMDQKNSAKTNEDRILVKLHAETHQDATRFHLFAIFDGHGNDIVSQWLKENCLDILEETLDVKNLEQSIQDAFRKLTEALDQEHGDEISWRGGSVACLVLLIQDKMYLIHLGDCRAVVLDEKGHVAKATEDHSPGHESSAARIDEAGGMVVHGRVFAKSSNVFPGVNVSRAFGGEKYRQVGIVSEPSFVEFADVQNKKLVIASDGVFTFLSNEEVAEIVWTQRAKTPEKVVQRIIRDAQDAYLKASRGTYMDDASCLLVILNPSADDPKPQHEDKDKNGVVKDHKEKPREALDDKEEDRPAPVPVQESNPSAHSSPNEEEDHKEKSSSESEKAHPALPEDEPSARRAKRKVHELEVAN